MAFRVKPGWLLRGYGLLSTFWKTYSWACFLSS